jgi:ubiquitin-like-conjugating enzyme ATG3
MKDIMAEYADKTVTNEFHPHLNTYMATIHPCKHADTLKFLTQSMLENGASKESIHADNSILIFLKFMGSVIPTIPFDFVAEVMIG